MRSSGQSGKAFLGGAVFSGAFLLGIFMIACSKPVDAPLSPDTTRAPVVAPTGTVREFVALDTLIGFQHTSALRWNITETNYKTIAKIIVGTDSIRIPVYGSMQTGALTGDTRYVLWINNGKTSLVTVRVADSLTTRLWNEGKRWRIVDALSYETQTVAGQPVRDWYSHYDDILKGQRTSFFLDGSSAEVQINGYPQPKPSGKFIAAFDPSQQIYKATFNWKGRLYLIDTITDDKLTVTFDTLLRSGLITTNRVRYKPEF